MANNIPPSIPSKKLAAPLAAAGTALILNDILDWNGTALTAADVPALMYVTLYNDAKTKLEVVEVDGTTIANAITVGATINKRGLSFDGGTTAAVKTAYDWNAGDTTVQLGSNPPQYYVSKAGSETITGAKTFTGGATFTSSVSVTSSLEVTGKGTFSSTVDITGLATLSSSLTVGSTANITSGLWSGGNITATSGLNATTGTFSSGISVTALGAFSSAVTIGSTCNVSSGIWSGGNITATSGLNATTGTFTSGLTVTALGAFSSAVTIGSTCNVTSGISVGGSMHASSGIQATTGNFSSSVDILGNLDITSGWTASTGNLTSSLNIGGQAYFSTATANAIAGGAVTIDWTKGNKQTLNTTGSGTISFTAPSGPANLMLKIVHNATTAQHVLTWPASTTMLWAGGTAFTSTTPASGAIDIVGIYYDGSFYGSASSSFS